MSIATTKRLLSTVNNGSKSICNFIYGNGLKEALRVLSGDDETEAALLALNTKSNEPEKRIESAINHLESAHISYRNFYSSINNVNDYLYHGALECINPCTKDINVCCLITVCYVALNDYQAARQWLQYGHKSCRELERIERISKKRVQAWNVPALFAGAKNIPGQINYIFKNGNDWLGMDSTDYSEFRDSINKIV